MVSWSRSCTSSCSTIGAGVFRPWLRTAPWRDGTPGRTCHRPWPRCWWPVCMGNAVRTRHVSCRHTSWKAQRPARPCVPNASGTWSLCWPLLYQRRPTWYTPVPSWTRKICLRTDGSLRTWFMQQQRWWIPTNCLWCPNVWPWTFPSRSPSSYMPMLSCICYSSGMTGWASTWTSDAGSPCTWIRTAITSV